MVSWESLFLHLEVASRGTMFVWYAISLLVASADEYFIIFSCRNLGGLPWWHSGEESTCQCRRLGFSPWVGKISWRRKWQPTAIFLPGKSHGQRSLAGLQSMGLQRTGHELVTKQQQQHQRHVNSCSAPFEPGYWSFGALPQAHIIRASRCSRNAPCICHQLLPFTHLWIFVILLSYAPESPAPGALSLTITWLPKSHIRSQGLLVTSLSSWVQSL